VAGFSERLGDVASGEKLRKIAMKGQREFRSSRRKRG
jgi:hypothetical protein